MDNVERSFNDMQTVKRRFFAMRNGVIADTLRRNGSPFRIIFGLNLPQIAEIAAGTPPDNDLAERLWANSTTRESMLIAPMLVDRSSFDYDDAIRWISSIPAREVADVICLKLLRHMPYVTRLAGELAQSGDSLIRYNGVRLMFNIMSKDIPAALAYAEAMLATETDSNCLFVARQLRDECRWMLEG